MQNFELTLPLQANDADMVRIIRSVLMAAGLEISLHGTLKQFPGCEHWHARSPGQSGTLEVTFWPQQHRAWLTIQSGRTAVWITTRLPEFLAKLEQGLAALAKSTGS